MMRPVDADTVPELLKRRAAATPDAVAYWVRSADGWSPVRWREFTAEVNRVAAGLRNLGLSPGDRLAIWVETRLEWLVAEFAAMELGACVVGIDPHAPAEMVNHVLAHARPAGLVVDRVSRLSDVAAEQLSELKLQIVIDADDKLATDGTVRWSSLGQDTGPIADLDAQRGLQPGSPATLIYTSGTSGLPKAIEFTHAQVMLACRTMADAYPELGPADTTVCWLPLAALFQRMMNYVAIARAIPAYINQDPRQIMDCIAAARPSVFVGVPRFYEKVAAGIRAELARLSIAQRRIAEWGLALGKRRVQGALSGARLPVTQRVAAALLDRLVLNRIRRVMGGRTRFLITGSAPTPGWVLELFHAAGMPLLEAYGLTESTLPVAANRPTAFRLGSVGLPFGGNELRIALDGEVLIRGPAVFPEVPGMSGAASRFTAEGFYRTGDLGELRGGYLYLTGRKSELIKTSTGRRIAPAKVEAVYRESPLIDQVVVFGNGSPHLVALIVPDRALLGAPADDVHALLDGELERLADRLAPYERVRRFAVLTEPLSIANGELTPTLKLRRAAIERRYASLIEPLLTDDDAPRDVPEVAAEFELVSAEAVP